MLASVSLDNIASAKLNSVWQANLPLCWHNNDLCTTCHGLSYECVNLYGNHKFKSHIYKVFVFANVNLN